MKPECRELEVLRSVHAAGGLEGEEAARVAAHLAACAECREADRLDRELLGLARLPPPGEAELLAVADLSGRTLRELRRRERRFTWLRRAGVGTGIAAVAAAAVLMLLAPHTPQLPPGTSGLGGINATTQVATAQDDGAAWDDDDLDTDAGSTSTSSSMSDVVLAAYDAGVGN